MCVEADGELRQVGLARWVLALCLLPAGTVFGLGTKPYARFSPGKGTFPLVADGKTTPLVVDATDWPGVRRAVSDLAKDEGRVTGSSPAILFSAGQERDVVLIGTIGHSALIDRLIRSGKLDARGIAGHWEMAVSTVVEHPDAGRAACAGDRGVG